MEENTQTLAMNIHEIREYLPHSYPFLLVDRVLEIRRNESVTAIKNVTINEPFFQGHFAQRPIMPGVLIVEGMAQACGLLAMKTDGKPAENEIFLFAGLDDVRFRSVVEPGDQLVYQATVMKKKKSLWVFDATAKVDDKIVCRAQIRTMKTGGG